MELSSPAEKTATLGVLKRAELVVKCRTRTLDTTRDTVFEAMVLRLRKGMNVLMALSFCYVGALGATASRIGMPSSLGGEVSAPRFNFADARQTDDLPRACFEAYSVPCARSPFSRFVCLCSLADAMVSLWPWKVGTTYEIRLALCGADDPKYRAMRTLLLRLKRHCRPSRPRSRELPRHSTSLQLSRVDSRLCGHFTPASPTFFPWPYSSLSQAGVIGTFMSMPVFSDRLYCKYQSVW